MDWMSTNRTQAWETWEQGAGHGANQRSENRGRRTEDTGWKWGAVRTSVTLLGQNIGNTVSIIVYSFSVSFAVFFVPKSTCPSRRRPNQTSIKSSAIGFRPTDQPPQTRAEEE